MIGFEAKEVACFGTAESSFYKESEIKLDFVEKFTTTRHIINILVKSDAP